MMKPLNSCFELKSITDDNVTVEMIFSDKTLCETLNILQKFLIASGYTVDANDSLKFVENPSLTVNSAKVVNTPVSDYDFSKQEASIPQVFQARE
jgi:hypothetical protein